MSDPATGDLLIPSIPASQALRLQLQQSLSSQSSSASPQRDLSPVSTGLSSLDDAISASTSASTPVGGRGGRGGGFARGSVAEVYGPPGVGKTCLLLNTAVKALAAGQHVVWIDTGSPIPKPRLQNLLSSLGSGSDKTATASQRLVHMRTPSLPHLLSLLAHPPPNFPPSGTSLVVVDSVSAPFQSYFPNATEIRSRLPPATPAGAGAGAGAGRDHQMQWLLNRKRNVASDLASHAAKLASTHSLAVVLLNQTHTKIKGMPRPTLYPALATGGAWESCIATRIVVYRDFVEENTAEADRSAKVRFAEMMKKGGKVLAAREEGDIIRFVIEDDGLRELKLQHESTPIPESISISLPVSVRKRKVGEIADSEDDESEFEDEEEYDWEET